MSINKRNVDTGDLGKPSQGTAMPSGTGTHEVHRRDAERATEDPQLRGVEGRKAGTPGRAELGLGTAEAESDEPMTAEQAEHLRVLCAEAGEPFDASLSQSAAERQIDRLQHRAGYKP